MKKAIATYQYLLKSTVIFGIRTYQRFLSPLFPPVCRYQPTCSEYAILAVKKYGVLRGGIYAAWRILKCNPLFKGGYDPLR